MNLISKYKNYLIEYCLVILIGIFSYLTHFHNLISRFSSHIFFFSDADDAKVYVWNTWHFASQLGKGVSTFYTDYFFYPMGSSLWMHANTIWFGLINYLVEDIELAINLGIAMQLTNISRDVVEDLNNGRSYINDNFNDIKSTLHLAEKFYENSFYSINEIPISFRFSILVARRVYRKIGHKILNKKNLENYKASGRIFVSNLEKIVETFFAIFDLIKLLLVNKNDNHIEHDHFLISEELNLNERI